MTHGPDIEGRDADLLPTFERLMLADYEDCELPCWWGLTPGETTLDEIARFLQETGFDRSWQLSSYTFSLNEYIRFGEPFFLQFEGYWSESGNFGIWFSFDEDILVNIHVQFQEIGDWIASSFMTVPNFLDQIETIPEIYLPPNEWLDTFMIGFVYPDLHTEVTYTFDLTDNYDAIHQELSLCLDDARTDRIQIRLNIPKSSMIGYSPSSVSLPIQEKFHISNEEFVQFFRENPDECLIVSEHIEPEETS